MAQLSWQTVVEWFVLCLESTNKLLILIEEQNASVSMPLLCVTCKPSSNVIMLLTHRIVGESYCGYGM